MGFSLLKNALLSLMVAAMAGLLFTATTIARSAGRGRKDQVPSGWHPSRRVARAAGRFGWCRMSFACRRMTTCIRRCGGLIRACKSTRVRPVASPVQKTRPCASGETHQPRWCDVLKGLTSLKYISEIRESFFE